MFIMKTKILTGAASMLAYLLTAVTVLTFFISCNKSEIKSTLAQQKDGPFSINELVYMPGYADQFTGTTSSPASSLSNKSDKYNSFYGPAIQMGNGHSRSWVNISHDGKVLGIGVEMTDEALHGLPTDPTAFAASTFILPLHQKAKELTAFDHVTINWNVHGHEPQHVYDRPHFDFHFYKISVADQLAIPIYPVAPAKFDANPPAGFMPPLYLHTPGGVPQMGAHWVNLLAPELNGGIFNHTFIYGSYDGKVTFEEPMITLATLESGNTIHQDIRQPDHYAPVNKYYPTRYNIWENSNNNRHYVSLDEMVWR